MDKQSLLSSIESFDTFCRFIQSYKVEEIVFLVANAFSADPKELARLPMGGYSRMPNDDASFSKGNGCYIYVLYDLKHHIDEYMEFYYRLCDDISRKVFMCQMRYRVVPAAAYLKEAYTLSAKYAQYFDEDIFKLGNDEVFVDCGGFIGDTAIEFIKRCDTYKRIHIFEPLHENVKKCRESLAGFDNIEIYQAGVGSHSSEMSFSGGGSSGSFAAVTQPDAQNAGDDVFEIVSLDEKIKEAVTFIKMDIECFEPEALRGASGHIQNDSPKLAICLYHMVSDLWEIPKLIHDISPNYDYYLRHYDCDNNWEYVLYAIPHTQK